MGRLHDLHGAGQSPWLDNLRRRYLHDGTLAGFVERGVRGVTSNPSIFQQAIAGSDDYDGQLAELLAGGASIDDAYWALVIDDIQGACDVLAPVHAASDGVDGFVSVEVDPRLAHDTAATEAAARALHARVDRSNVMIKIPATLAGLPAIRTATAAGTSVNVTLIFSVERHRQVMDAYLAGLEDRMAAGTTDLSDVASVASFFISRVDTEIDRRLDASDDPGASDLRGRAAIAQARLAYAAFRETFAGPRWERLAAAGARVQRPLWASTSTKDPAYADTRYVDALIGPDTVDTLPEVTLAAFEERGTVARTIDADPAGARADLEALTAAGIDLAEVAVLLEDQGVAAFEGAFEGLLDTMAAKASA